MKTGDAIGPYEILAPIEVSKAAFTERTAAGREGG